MYLKLTKGKIKSDQQDFSKAQALTNAWRLHLFQLPVLLEIQFMKCLSKSFLSQMLLTVSFGPQGKTEGISSMLSKLEGLSEKDR